MTTGDRAAGGMAIGVSKRHPTQSNKEATLPKHQRHRHEADRKRASHKRMLSVPARSSVIDLITQVLRVVAEIIDAFKKP